MSACSGNEAQLKSYFAATWTGRDGGYGTKLLDMPATLGMRCKACGQMWSSHVPAVDVLLMTYCREHPVDGAVLPPYEFDPYGPASDGVDAGYLTNRYPAEQVISGRFD